ncbi:MAG: hypothetical protein ACRES6_10585 [Steroidobacteraceae bacterium]
MTAERFYVRESVGGHIAVGYGAKSGSRIHEYMVLDRAYCHRVVWTSARGAGGSGLRLHPSPPGGGRRSSLRGRAAAEEIARRLNVWDAAAAGP